MPHITKLHLTTLNEKSKAGKTREPAAASKHLLVGMKIAIQVLPSMGSHSSDDAWSCVNNDCFDVLAFANRKFWTERKSKTGDFEPSGDKTAALHTKLIT